MCKYPAFCPTCDYHFQSVQPMFSNPKCPKCGKRAKWQRFCPTCGHEINEDKKLNSC